MRLLSSVCLQLLCNIQVLSQSQFGLDLISLNTEVLKLL